MEKMAKHALVLFFGSHEMHTSGIQHVTVSIHNKVTAYY